MSKNRLVCFQWNNPQRSNQ